jgi:serine/threonine-protein kinase
VVLTPEGAKLLDLGAATASRAASHDEYASGLRRPPHWAPERVPGGVVSPAADVYALGVLMYWLLTDQPAAAPHAVPAEVADIYHRCLASDPEARPTAADVAMVLNSPPSPSSAAPGLSSVDDDTAMWLSAGRAPAAIESHRDRRRRSPVVIIVGVAAVVLLVGVIAVLVSIGQPDGTSATGGTPARTAADDGASPTSLDPSPTTPASTPSAEGTPLAGTTPAQPADQTLTAVGGTVQARCQGNAAKLVAAQPAAGFAIADSNQRGNQIQVVFTSQTHRSEVRARCGPQGLVPTIRETAP